jgi:hypothetical protein
VCDSLAVSHGVIDCNDDVLAVRRLRGAAFLPKVLALAFAVVGLLLFVLDVRTRSRWTALAGSAVLLALLGRAIEHGAVWAVWLLALLVGALSALMVAAAVIAGLDRTEPWGEWLGGLAGTVLLLTGSWLLVRLGLQAVRRRGTPPAWIVTETRSGWQWLPRDERFRTGLATFTAAILIYVGGAVVAAGVGVGTGITFLAALAYLPIARAAGRVWTRGRRQLALRLQEVRKLDARPPVILLRSFEDDNLPLETRYRMLWFFSAAKEAFTLEEYVVSSVWRCGPVIAIGNPRERLNPLGAAREYVPEDRWRDAIHQYLDEAVLVVCILGSTPGLRWEYEAIAARRRKTDVVIVFPPRSREQLVQRWDAFKGSFDPAVSVDLSSDPRLGEPLLALFSGAERRPSVFYSRFNNETAYGVAFARLLAHLGNV